MAYGILKSSTNTGLDSELFATFSTPLKVVSNQPVYAADTASLRRIVTWQQVQRWEVESAIAPTNDSGNFLGHSVMNGYHTTIYIRMPQVYRASKMSGGLSLTVGAPGATIGGTTVNISGVGASGLPVGEFIQFGTDKKVYVVTDSGTGSGTGTKVFPPLKASYGAGAVVTYGDKVTMACRYDVSTVLGIQYTDGVLSDPGSVKFIEVI
jgi:hypothetical protein